MHSGIAWLMALANDMDMKKELLDQFIEAVENNRAEARKRMLFEDGKPGAIAAYVINVDVTGMLKAIQRGQTTAAQLPADVTEAAKTHIQQGHQLVYLQRAQEGGETLYALINVSE